MVTHNPDTGVTRVKMPSGSKKARCALMTKMVKSIQCVPAARTFFRCAMSMAKLVHLVSVLSFCVGFVVTQHCSPASAGG